MSETMNREDLATILVSSECDLHDREAAATMLRGDAEAVEACEVLGAMDDAWGMVNTSFSGMPPTTRPAPSYSATLLLDGDECYGEGSLPQAAIIAAHRSLVAEDEGDLQ